jgi:hypothetical protein
MAEGRAPTDEQQVVLQAIYARFRMTGTWPTFIAIDRPLRRAHNMDVGATIQRIPRSHLLPPRSGSLRPHYDDKLRLTVVGIARCYGGAEDIERFTSLLRWLAQKEVECELPPPGADGEAFPQISAEDIREHLGLDVSDKIAFARLFEMLQLDHWGLGGYGGEPGNWQITLGPDIWRFKDVRSAEDCAAARQRWIDEDHPGELILSQRGAVAELAAEPEPAYLSFDQQQVTVPPPIPAYVNPEIVADIQKKDGDRFDCSKLLKLLQELEDNYQSSNAYAAHALLRAILDHVPPILDKKTFQEVANGYTWSTTDKSYMKKLLDFRVQGNDALHRPILSKKQPLLELHDIPPRVYLNTLLRECADKL